MILAQKTNKLDYTLSDKLKKILPYQSWLNEEKVGAYFVNNGTTESIIDENGLISENELDSVSENIAKERDKILSLYIKAKKK